MRIASVHLLHLLASETSINKKEKAMSYNQESKNSMTLKEFGDKFINDVNPIVDTNPYLAFFIMSAALEFISRCKACLPNFHKKDGSSDRYVKDRNNMMLGRIKSDGYVFDRNNMTIGRAKDVPIPYAAVFFFFNMFEK